MIDLYVLNTARSVLSVEVAHVEGFTSHYNIPGHVLYKASVEIWNALKDKSQVIRLEDEAAEEIRKVALYDNLDDFRAYLKWSQGR